MIMLIITAWAIIIDNNKKILLVKRPSDKKLFPNAWSFPGGKLEEWESLEEAVVREVKEETWLDLISFEQYSFTGQTPQNTRSINHLYIGKAKWILIPETEAKRYLYDETKWLNLAFNQGEIIEELHKNWKL